MLNPYLHLNIEMINLRLLTLTKKNAALQCQENSNKHPASFRCSHLISVLGKLQNLNNRPRKVELIPEVWFYFKVLIGFFKVIWCYLVLFKSIFYI